MVLLKKSQLNMKCYRELQLWKLNQSHAILKSSLLKGYHSKGLHIAQQASVICKRLQSKHLNKWLSKQLHPCELFSPLDLCFKDELCVDCLTYNQGKIPKADFSAVWDFPFSLVCSHKPNTKLMPFFLLSFCGLVVIRQHILKILEGANR